MVERNIAPEYKEITEVEIIKPVSATLDNGVSLHVLRAGSESVVRFELIFKAGHWYEPYNGVSFFTAKLLSAGTSKYTAKQIEEQIAFYGAFLELSPGYDRCTVAVYTLSKHLESVTKIIFEMISDSIFPEEEIENLKKITFQNLKINQEKTSFLATKNFRELIFGKDHPYGRAIDEGALAAANQEVIKKYHRENINYKNCDIIISGNGTEDFHSIINKIFGTSKWGGDQISQAPSILNYKPANNALLVEKPDSVQSSIRMGLHLFPINHPDYFKLYLLIEIFGGYFGSRLMKNIREEKGYTYGISANYTSLKNAGYMSINTDVNKENTANTINEIYKEINILKSEPVSKEELTVVTNYLLGSFVSSLSTPFGLADKFKTIYFNDLGYSFYDKYIQSLKTVTSPMLLETANQYFRDDKMFEVVAGGK